DVCTVAVSPTDANATELAVGTEASDRVARIILQTAADFGGRMGRMMIADVLAGSRRKRITELKLEQAKNYGALRLSSRDQVIAWMDELVARQLLMVTAEEYPRLRITPEGRRALGAGELLPLSGFANRAVSSDAGELRVKKVAADEAAGHRTDDEELPARPPTNGAGVGLLADRLKQWRREKAAAQNVSAFLVLHNGVLEEIAQRRPRTLAELQIIKGIGPNKIESYGEELLEIVRSLPAEIESAGTEGMSVAEADEEPPALPAGLRLQIEMWRQRGDEPDRQSLLAALENHAALEHAELMIVLQAVSQLGLREAAGVLGRLLGETTNGNLLPVICEGVGRFGVAGAVPDLMGLLDDERPAVRRAAVRALGTLRAEAALARLELLANDDPSDYVRLAARAAVLLMESQGG